MVIRWPNYPSGQKHRPTTCSSTHVRHEKKSHSHFKWLQKTCPWNRWRCQLIIAIYWLIDWLTTKFLISRSTDWLIDWLIDLHVKSPYPWWSLCDIRRCSSGCAWSWVTLEAGMVVLVFSENLGEYLGDKLASQMLFVVFLSTSEIPHIHVFILVSCLCTMWRYTIWWRIILSHTGHHKSRVDKENA